MSEEKYSVYDAFHDRQVVVQLKGIYYAVTAPGVPHAVPELIDPAGLHTHDNIRAVPNRLPVLVGICQVDKDDYGNVRIVIVRQDPDPDKAGQVLISADPTEIALISMCYDEKEDAEDAA